MSKTMGKRVPLNPAREFAVKAEGPSGTFLTIRRGFISRDAAEDHPVKLASWKRVWVEEVTPRPIPSNTLPSLPWAWEVAGSATANGSFHAYIVDATGRKIAAIWGRGEEKRLIAEAILSGVNGSEK